MATTILGFDSDFDKTTQLVSNWRNSNVYPSFIADGHSVQNLNGTMAVRMYLGKELVKPGITYFSASGHGLYDEFKGSDGFAALRVGEYHPSEATPKIFHLLSCHTAFELGTDVVENGCISFFGYDAPFAFFEEYLDEFMAPDAALDDALSKGKDVAAAYTIMIEVYDDMIAKLIADGKPDYAVVMDRNKAHLCCANRHSQWGKTNVKI
jgi:hypothetical protein